MLYDFFGTAVERYRIRLLRDQGNPPPWTDNPVFRDYRFCNVFREDDKTTQWFRIYIRHPLSNDHNKVILATAAFRMFNFIGTGERISAILNKHGWHEGKVRKAMAGADQVVTGAYMVRSPYGMSKLDGICEMMRMFKEARIPQQLRHVTTLQEAHAIIEAVPYQGHFTAYEIVTDLSHTCVLENATDIMTWANPGPGAQRGLGWLPNGRIFGRGREDIEEMNYLMREILRLSRPGSFYWPEVWPQWTMREVEHWLCEYDKYCRARAGQRLKRRFQP